MKSFFSNVVSSFFGVLLASLALGFIAITLLVGLVVSVVDELESGSGVQDLEQNSVMILRLNYPIAEKTSEDPFDHYDFNTLESRLVLGLDDIIEGIHQSATDPRIEGLYLNIDPMNHGWANSESIRNALLTFKESGKWIVAYNEQYSHQSYYLSSVADELYLNPEGLMQFQGLSAQSMFLKDSLEKLDIQMQVLRAPDNEYKSAIETFTNTQMSDRSRFQTQVLVDEIWANTIQNISQSRNIPEKILNQIADNLALDKPQAALDFKLIDGLRYKDEIRELIKEKMQIAQTEKIPAIGIEDYSKLQKDKNLLADFAGIDQGDKIAVIFADGNIMSGENSSGVVGSRTTAYAIRSAREDNDVKAMVVRVNSPGGSALASDVILREVFLSAQQKPTIVSFGNVAASGGYYIGAAGDKIFAEPTTVTGSIGVFSLLPNLQGFFNNKLGVRFDSVNTHAYSDFGNLSQALKPFEQETLQRQLQSAYTTFKSHVAQGRSMSEAQVEEVAKGRVWSGIAAQKVGLVDEIGGLNDAIKEAAAMANISDYRLLKLPREETPFDRFTRNSGEHARAWLLDSLLSHSVFEQALGPVVQHYKNISQLQSEQGVQARMPFTLTIQ